jgi:hypothetical protein
MDKHLKRLTRELASLGIRDWTVHDRARHRQLRFTSLSGESRLITISRGVPSDRRAIQNSLSDVRREARR